VEQKSLDSEGNRIIFYRQMAFAPLALIYVDDIKTSVCVATWISSSAYIQPNSESRGVMHSWWKHRG